MTLQAVFPQLSPMPVIVAGDAVAGQSKKRAIQILHLDRGALRFSDVFRFVTLLARDFSMLPLEGVPSSLVVKSLLRKAPVNQGEVLAVVLRMAANTVFAGGSDADD